MRWFSRKRSSQPILIILSSISRTYIVERELIHSISPLTFKNMLLDEACIHTNKQIMCNKITDFEKLYIQKVYEWLLFYYFIIVND